MSMASTLERYLHTSPTHYDLIDHPHTATSLQSAHHSHIPREQMAKAVVLADESERYVMAVLPATQKVEFERLHEQTGRSMYLADETEFQRFFADCERGAVPPVGAAYGVETIWDEALLSEPDLYFEAGDHETLVHMKTSDFIRLLGDAEAMDFAAPANGRSPFDFSYANNAASWSDADDSN